MLRKVEICGVDTSKLPVIPDSRLKEYFSRINAGDPTAREEFLYGNLRLVLSVVQRFSSRASSMDDLFQVGCVGLIKAVDNFDVDQGVRFSTYAVPMIIGEIRRYLRDFSPIRVSRSLRDTACRAFTARNALAAKNGSEPTVEEIARELSLPAEDVVYALDAVQDPISLSQPVCQDGSDALFVIDGIADERLSDERFIASLALADAVEKLPVNEKYIIRLQYYEGKTQMEVADEIHISQAQVSRLEKNAIRSMRKDYLP